MLVPQWGWFRDGLMSMADKEDKIEFPSGPPTELEMQQLRRIIQADERARWLWSSARTLAIWITAITIAIATMRGFLLDLFTGKH